ncbi:MAG: hypothetical protein H7095_03560 [Pseudopedobacter sp.]|nr:hypothetical protein [Deinococcales bacterium]
MKYFKPKYFKLAALTLCAPLLGSCWLIFPAPPPSPPSLFLSFGVPEIPSVAVGNAYLGVFWYDAEANPYPVVTSRLEGNMVPLEGRLSPPPPPSGFTGRETFISGYELQKLQENPKFLLSLQQGEARDKGVSQLGGADGARTGTLYPFVWQDLLVNGKFDPVNDKILFDTNDVISYANKDFSYSFDGNSSGISFRETGKRRQGWTHVHHFVLTGTSGNELTWNSLATNSPSLYKMRLKEPTDVVSSMEVKP